MCEKIYSTYHLGSDEIHLRPEGLKGIKSIIKNKILYKKSTEKRDEMKETNIFLSRALYKEYSIKENLCLKRRREKLEKGVPREKKKIRNLELFHDGAKVQLNRTSQPEQENATSNV